MLSAPRSENRTLRDHKDSAATLTRRLEALEAMLSDEYPRVPPEELAKLETELDEAATLGKAPRVQEPAAVPWYAPGQRGSFGQGQQGSSWPRRWCFSCSEAF